MRTTGEGVRRGGVAVLRSPVATVSRRVYSDRQSFFLQGLAAWGTSGVWAEEDNVGLQPPPLASDCGDRTKCTPCDFPRIDVCFGSGKCGPDHCRCVMNKMNDKCICVDK
jgi:hypothetical protein